MKVDMTSVKRYAKNRTTKSLICNTLMDLIDDREFNNLLTNIIMLLCYLRLKI